ncbi:MAG: hypothetical protein JWO41_1 [Candidatus Saccharibacteria bacterium]|nr:hypothetical protein [Candidatus Saccharibacteria bacterium]
MTNSQYLQTNNYVNTNKLYAAFQFAGMINEINTKQYVVFAMDDSIWDNLTASQVAWMNASPANMRSVLGWQVATYCITYDGVNPIKGRSAPLAFNTLNGTVTYTAGGVGQLDGTPVYIWDWFTSNGAVTITDFIHPPVGH